MATKLFDADLFKNDAGQLICLEFGKEYLFGGMPVVYDGWYKDNNASYRACYKTNGPISGACDPFDLKNLDGSLPSPDTLAQLKDLLARIRPGSEVAPWVYEALTAIAR